MYCVVHGVAKSQTAERLSLLQSDIGWCCLYRFGQDGAQHVSFRGLAVGRELSWSC